MTYTHRNGEKEAPTVMGVYWFRGQYSNSEIQQNLYRLQHYPETGDWVCVDTFGSEDTYHSHEFNGQWWGPVASPWGE